MLTVSGFIGQQQVMFIKITLLALATLGKKPLLV